MNHNFKDLSGMRFGMLTVTNDHEIRGEKYQTYMYWRCVCDCGRELWVRGSQLSYGTTKSCGHHRECIHGLSNKRIYTIYYDMIQRCTNPNHPSYADYGGRGIRVCDEWLRKGGVVNFNNWAESHDYDDTLTIERIDVNGDYCPENCKWIPPYQQQWNKRNSVRTNYKDTYVSIPELPDDIGVSRSVIRSRISSGWDDDSVFDIPPEARSVFHNGKNISLKELSEITGISLNTLHTRYNHGFTDEDIVKPVGSMNNAKTVLQYTKEGVLVGLYESGIEASKETGVSKSGIRMCCLGKRKTCLGFIWKYEDDNNKNERDRFERCKRRKEGGGWIDERGRKIS